MKNISNLYKGGLDLVQHCWNGEISSNVVSKPVWILVTQHEKALRGFTADHTGPQSIVIRVASTHANCH